MSPPNEMSVTTDAAALWTEARGEVTGQAEKEPTRPEGHGADRAWTGTGGMESENRAANDRHAALNRNIEQKQNSSTDLALAIATLDQHIDNQDRGQGPGQAPDLGRKPHDIER